MMDSIVDTASARSDARQVVVGGANRIVGGWSQHTIDSRRERAEATRALASPHRPGAAYGGRAHIYASDVVESVVADDWRQRGALRAAAGRLGAALARLEDRLCEPDDDGLWECGSISNALKTRAQTPAHWSLTTPPLTSADLAAVAADPSIGADAVEMGELAEAVTKVAAAVGVILPPIPELARMNLTLLPPLPTHAVEVTDDSAVLRLEADTLPRLESLEGVQAELARRMESATEAIAARTAKKR